MENWDAPFFSGNEAFQKALGRMVNHPKFNRIDSKQLVVMGDNAYDYGTFSETSPDATGKTVTRDGYYVVTLHKQADGSWKINHHVATTPPKM
jgi:ketosteroid isomerase-like protein